MKLGEIYLRYFKGNNRIERIWKLAQVDFRKRYYNDRLGLLWALLNPLLQMAIYFIIFTTVYNTDQENFALFIFSGLIIWICFSESTNKGMNVLNSKRYLIDNIQFEYVDIFISSTLSVFMGLCFNLAMYFLFAVLSGLPLTWHVIFLPLMLAITYLLCLGISLVLSTIAGIIKDIKHFWNIILLAGFFGSGIFYPGEKIIEAINGVEFINPILGIIINIRRVIFHGILPDFTLLVYNLIFIACFTSFSWLFYRRFVYLSLEKL